MPTAARHLPRAFLVLTLSALCLVPELTAAKAAKVKQRNADGDDVSADAADIKINKREDKANAKVSKDDPASAESRQLSRLRERLDVADDAEWAVISDRIGKVEELRRNLASGARGARVAPAAAANDKNRRNARAGGSANPEYDALRAAVTDDYPDAEIKSRLARAHDAYQQREAQLARAQADLRSVLSVRQEAMVVMFGLLPP